MRVRRAGFTLVELLVVISIIGLLMSLLLPAINAARKTAQLGVCTARLGDIGKAIQVYSTNKRFFPGYRSPKLNANGQPVSWQISLLPFMDQQSLYETFLDIKTPQGLPKKLDLYVCPVDANAAANITDPLNSYVVNTGKPGNDVTYSRNEGICHDLVPLGAATVVSPALKLATDQIPDGSQSTVLATENLDANFWNNVNTNEDLLGCQWGVAGQYRINQSKALRTDFTAVDNKYARPSSNHDGVVVVLFAAGNARAVDENVAFDVWEALMSPDGKKCNPTQPLLPADGTY